MASLANWRLLGDGAHVLARRGSSLKRQEALCGKRFIYLILRRRVGCRRWPRLQTISLATFAVSAARDWSQSLAFAGRVSAAPGTGPSRASAVTDRWPLKANGRRVQSGRHLADDCFRPGRTQQIASLGCVFRVTCDSFMATLVPQRMSPKGRLESAAPAAAGHSRLDTAAKRSERPPSHCSPTFKVAPAAEVKVGLMAVSVSSPDRGDRLLTLRSCLSRPEGRLRTAPRHSQRHIDRQLR